MLVKNVYGVIGNNYKDKMEILQMALQLGCHLHLWCTNRWKLYKSFRLIY